MKILRNNHWQKKKLKDAAEFINGRGFKKSEWSRKGKPIIRIQNLTGSTSTTNYFEGFTEEKHKVKDGDLLVSWSATIGSYIYKGEEAVLNQHIFKAVPKINKLFLHYYLTYIGQLLYSKTHGTGMSHITKGIFDDIDISFPESKTEQEKIVDKIEEFFSVINVLENTLAKLVTLSNQFSKKLLSCQMESDSYVRLEDTLVFGPKNGTSPKGVSFETPVKNLTLTSTTGGNFDPKYYKYVDLYIEDYVNLTLKTGDILVQRGNTIDYVGTAALIREDYPDYIYPDLMMKVRVSNKWNPEFITYALHLQRFLGYFRDNATGTSGNMPKINQEVLNSTPIPDIVKEKQDTIVHEIKTHASIIDNLSQSIETMRLKIKSLKQSILKQAFEGKLV